MARPPRMKRLPRKPSRGGGGRVGETGGAFSPQRANLVEVRKARREQHEARAVFRDERLHAGIGLRLPAKEATEPIVQRFDLPIQCVALLA